MTAVESSRETSRIVDGLVELERLRWLEPAHCIKQRGLARLVLADKACEVADLELFAVLDRSIVLNADFCELHCRVVSRVVIIKGRKVSVSCEETTAGLGTRIWACTSDRNAGARRAL